MAQRHDLFWTRVVHTTYDPAGEIRGQLVPTIPIPEPETYAMMLVGLGLVGWQMRRKMRQSAASRFV